MKISDGRINWLSRQIAEKLVSNRLVTGVNGNDLAKEIKKAFNFFIQAEDGIDKKVREKIASIKRGVPEGSGEWDILYRQYYSEEIEKL